MTAGGVIIVFQRRDFINAASVPDAKSTCPRISPKAGLLFPLPKP